jgi:hypothetical protein
MVKTEQQLFLDHFYNKEITYSILPAFRRMKMNTIKTFKKIESNNLYIDGLEKYKGSTAEIIILIEDTEKKDIKTAKDNAFDIINSSSGKISKWKRDDLYER